MMSELLGLPDTKRAELVACCDRLKDFTMARRVGRETVLKAKKAIKSFQAIRAYVRTMIATRREKFEDDVIGRSFAVEPNEAPPTEDDVLANGVLFLHTGVLNMSASITNAVVTLLQHPKQLPVSARIPSPLRLRRRNCCATRLPFRSRSAAFRRKWSSQAGGLDQSNCLFCYWARRTATPTNSPNRSGST